MIVISNKKPPVLVTVVMLLVFLFSGNSAGDTTPVIGLHQNTPNVVALQNARIVTAAGRIIPQGTLVVRGDRIELLGEGITPPPDAVTRDLAGKTIYPGFIDLFSSYGIPKKEKSGSAAQGQASGAVSRGTGHWNQAVRPELSAAGILLPDGKKAAAYRKSGFTAVVSLPAEGIFRGSGALVMLSDTLARRAVLSEKVAGAFSFDKGSGLPWGGDAGYPSSLQGHIALVRQTMLDARWYTKAWEAFSANPDRNSSPEKNLSLAALAPYAEGAKPLIFEASRELDLFRAAQLKREFGLKMWAVGTGHEYRRLHALKELGLKLIIPVNFPEAPDVDTPAKERDVSLRELKHWDFAPENPGRLAGEGVEFALTASGLEKPEEFLEKLRVAVARGLSEKHALAALTATPARWLGASAMLGSLERGKLANLVITDGDIFQPKTKIIETWVAGKAYPVNTPPLVDIRGQWNLRISSGEMALEGTLQLSGKATKPVAELMVGETKIKAGKASVDKRLLSLIFPGDSLGRDGHARLSGTVDGDSAGGQGTWGDGTDFGWRAALVGPLPEKPDTAKESAPEMSALAVAYPDGAFGGTGPPEQPAAVLVKEATLWTCGQQGVLKQADLLVRDGKIAAVGSSLEAPPGAVVIDATGKHLTPGIIDPHSHLAIVGGVNENSQAITSEVRISDVINCDDINIYRQLAGGVTTSLLLHGSANPIGGQNTLVKLRWGSLPDEMLYRHGMPTIKFALGENVTQAYRLRPSRYPASRMGVEQFFLDWFGAAKEYRGNWETYNAHGGKKSKLVPPRRDLRLEPLLEVLDGKRWVHCHAYRQDETLAMIRVAEETGFKVSVLVHVLEGYKNAEALRAHGAMPSTFSDWWGYKFEVYDAIPYNGALMHDQNLTVSFNSDNIELARRMNLEAAKAVKYGGVEPRQALKFVTLNPAIQLGIDQWTGSLEVGKDADFVLWSGDPLSTFSLCEQTWIDGRKYFDIEQDRILRSETSRQRVELVQKILRTGNSKD